MRWIVLGLGSRPLRKSKTNLGSFTTSRPNLVAGMLLFLRNFSTSLRIYTALRPIYLATRQCFISNVFPTCLGIFLSLICDNDTQPSPDSGEALHGKRREFRFPVAADWAQRRLHPAISTQGYAAATEGT